MSWGVTLTGSKEQAKAAAIAASDMNIANGYQTEAQKAAVLALIDAAVGTHIGGSIGGHNNADGSSGTIAANLTTYTPKLEPGTTAPTYADPAEG